MRESRLTLTLRGVSHTLALFSTKRLSFNNEWNSALAPTSGDALEGRWKGEWSSERSGHHGDLQCLFQRVGGGQYRARFHTHYAAFVRIGYTVLLKTTPAEKGFWFQGRVDLGRLAGGVYRYEGLVKGGDLQCTYRCGDDFGRLSLSPDLPGASAA